MIGQAISHYRIVEKLAWVEMRSHLKKYSACLALIALLSPSSRAANKHAFGVDDWTGLRSARAVAISPDGRSILYWAGSGVARGSTNEEYWLVAPDFRRKRR